MKILLVTSRYPWPPRRGDQVRALQVAEFLAREHEVTLLAPAPRPGEAAPAAPPAFQLASYRRRWWTPPAGLLRALAGGLPWQSALFYQPDLGRELRRRAAAADLVVLQLVRLAPHLADVGGTPLAVDLIDCLSLNFARRARFDRAWLRPLLRGEAGRLARWERRLIERARLVLVVSERDRDALVAGLDPEAAARVAVVPIAREKEGGRAGGPVESAAPGAASGGRRPAPGEVGPPTLVFTGNLGYFPNADAVRWWLRRVWPDLAALRRRFSGVRVVIAGDRPGRAVRRAVRRARAAGTEVVLVESPPDLGAVLAGATVDLAPLRAGSGVPIKVLEAWAAGVPVVASPWAAAGLGVPAGVAGDGGEGLLVAESPAEWGAALAELLAEAPTRHRLVDAGRARLVADYAPARVAERLLALVRSRSHLLA